MIWIRLSMWKLMLSISLTKRDNLLLSKTVHLSHKLHAREHLAQINQCRKRVIFSKEKILILRKSEMRFQKTLIRLKLSMADRWPLINVLSCSEASLPRLCQQVVTSESTNTVTPSLTVIWRFWNVTTLTALSSSASSTTSMTTSESTQVRDLSPALTRSWPAVS